MEEMNSAEKKALSKRLRKEINSALCAPMSTEEFQELFLLLTPCERNSIN